MVESLKTVLVVDDNRDFADTLAMLVGFYGHKVSVAYDVASGLALAHQLMPDVILHDIGFPRLSGHEAARQLRSYAKFAKTVLVALTGYDSRSDRAHSKKAGFDFHLDKPIDLGAITIALGQSRPN
jgi:CheY-like chemotaxis protein